MAYGGKITDREIEQAFVEQALMDYGYEMTRPYFETSRGEYVGRFYVINPDGIDPYKLADALVDNGMEDYTVRDSYGSTEWEIEVVIETF
ncbi:MAG: hypothetical protein CMI60_11390 [Parvibaculum sp.]|nr:hypothetical protein [Parvibaculum sp.]|tara:strand:- start:603 stop:872 length:270 start_codon:yes stop_codon:yes gene_type:complete